MSTELNSEVRRGRRAVVAGFYSIGYARHVIMVFKMGFISTAVLGAREATADSPKTGTQYNGMP